MAENKHIEEALEILGFISLGEHHDMGGCAAPIEGKILQFYNLKTKEAVQFCIGPLTDDLMFDEELALKVNSHFGKNHGMNEKGEWAK